MTRKLVPIGGAGGLDRGRYGRRHHRQFRICGHCSVVDIEEVIGGLEQRRMPNEGCRLVRQKFKPKAMLSVSVGEAERVMQRLKALPPSVKQLWHSRILSFSTEARWPTGMTSWNARG